MTFSFNAKFWKLLVIFAVAAFSVGFLAGVLWRCIPMFIFLLQLAGDP